MSITPAPVAQPIFPPHHSVERQTPKTCAHVTFPSYFKLSTQNLPGMSSQAFPREGTTNLHFPAQSSLSPSPAQVA